MGRGSAGEIELNTPTRLQPDTYEAEQEFVLSMPTMLGIPALQWLDEMEQALADGCARSGVVVIEVRPAGGQIVYLRLQATSPADALARLQTWIQVVGLRPLHYKAYRYRSLSEEES